MNVKTETKPQRGKKKHCKEIACKNAPNQPGGDTGTRNKNYGIGKIKNPVTNYRIKTIYRRTVIRNYTTNNLKQFRTKEISRRNVDIER